METDIIIDTMWEETMDGLDGSRGNYGYLLYEVWS